MNTSLQTIDIRLPLGNLDAYISCAHQIPMLSQTEEFALAKRVQEENDLDAAKGLILPHLRYVISVAKSYSGYGLPLGDLIQEGNIGLMKAVKRFDPNMGVRLVSFAVHWIKSQIHEFVLANWRIVKIATTKAQRKLFFNLRSAKKRLGWFTNAEIDAVAKDLGVKPETVSEMELRLNSYDAAFDAHEDDDEETLALVPANYLADHRYDPAHQLETHHGKDQHKQALYLALENLDDRSQDILTSRWLADEKVTLEVLAEKYNISAERVRQLEKNAMQKLQVALQPVA